MAADAGIELVVVHARSAGVLSPVMRQLQGLVDAELKLVVGPVDDAAVAGVEKELQHVVPQLVLRLGTAVVIAVTCMGGEKTD